MVIYWLDVLNMTKQRDSVAEYYKLPWFFRFFAKMLNLISKSLATAFIWRIFCGPIKFKTPKRELNFYHETEQNKLYINSIAKEVAIYTIQNNGPKILFVHGWNGRASQFYSMIETFTSEGYDITAVDLPGHGKSDTGITNLPEFTAVINEISDLRGPFHAVISHSIGAVSTLNSVRKGLKTQKLVLISTGAYSIRPMFESFVGLFNLNEKYYADRMYSLAEQQFGSSPSDFGPDKFAKEINVNTLLIHCRDDVEAFPEIAEKIQKDMKNAKLYMTQDLKHRRILRDSNVTEQILNFIS